MKPNNNEINLPPKNEHIATLAGGCFWCLEPIYADLKGITKVEVGYSGGGVPNPSYQLVCTGSTGHAEAVQIWFDPQVISFKEILDIFFTFHDPTTLNRQGADVGTQYRSAIFYHTDEQEATAYQVIREMQAAGIWNGPFVTEVTPFKTFFKAEQYHQGYFERNPDQGYCRVVIAPKVAKFRKKFTSKLKSAG